jgi:hypothetical protein
MSIHRLWATANKIGIQLLAHFQNTSLSECMIYGNTNYNGVFGDGSSVGGILSINQCDFEAYPIVNNFTNLVFRSVQPVSIHGLFTEQAGGTNSIDIYANESFLSIDTMYANGSGQGAGTTNGSFVTSSIALGINTFFTLRNSWLINFVGDDTGIILGTNSSGTHTRIEHTLLNTKFVE